MTYDGQDQRGFHRFKLARAHQGAAVYHGCSGAPIAGPDGCIVSLVQGGSREENVIYGVPLVRYARAMMLEAHQGPKPRSVG